MIENTIDNTVKENIKDLISDGENTPIQDSIWVNNENKKFTDSSGKYFVFKPA